MLPSRFRTAVLASLLGAGVLLAGCDDGGAGDATPGGTPATAPSGTARAAAAVETAPPGAATFRVLAGSKEGAYDIEQFMPAAVRVRAGDTVEWTVLGHESHTVSFIPDGRADIFEEYLRPSADDGGALRFNPAVTLSSEAQGSYDGTVAVNSGSMGVPIESTFSLTFPTEGVYAYVCLIHPLHMTGTVTVTSPDATVASPAAVAQQAQDDRARFIDVAREAQQAAQAERARQDEAAGGAAYHVSVGVDSPQAQIMAMVPGEVEIDRGATVTFFNSERDFHNVVFAPPDREIPQFPLLRPPPEGRKGYYLAINPEAQAEVPPPAGFGPDAYFSSGLMGVFFPRRHYSVTFTQPGVYRYACSVHASAGMAGVVRVR